MLTREDFLTILKNTIENYYRCVYNKEIIFSYEKFDNSECIVINKLLSFVTRKSAPASLWKHLNSEYNIRGSYLKYLMAKVAIVAACCNTSVGKFKYAYITKGCIGDNVIISPQNRSIRIYDYNSNSVDSIIKSGFTNKYFKTQLDFRLNHNYSFLNPLLAYGENWFREPILIGHPLVRETNQARFDKGFSDTIKYIKQIINDSVKYVIGADYIQKLSDSFTNKLESAKNRKNIKTYYLSKHLLGLILYKLGKSDYYIPICLSHGDLQSGNVWVNPDGTCLIYDWETVGRRSVWYDRAILEYELRRSWGWPNFIKAEDITKINTEGIKIDVSISKEMIKAIVLLEDLHFYIDDMLELPFDWGNREYDEFVNSISCYIK